MSLYHVTLFTYHSYCQYMDIPIPLVCFILSVNYRGSIGYGQDNILSLLGNVGSQDVKDVQVSVHNSHNIFHVMVLNIFTCIQLFAAW